MLAFKMEGFVWSVHILMDVYNCPCYGYIPLGTVTWMYDSHMDVGVVIKVIYNSSKFMSHNEDRFMLHLEHPVLT